MLRACLLAALAVSLSGCNGTPTRPDRGPYNGRMGTMEVTVNCGETGRSPLVCRATGRCGGLYPYCPGFTSGDDVTTSVTWYSENENIAHLTDSGVFVAGSPGDTVAGVRFKEAFTVSVYDDGAIFRSLVISGSVFDAWPAQRPPITGALVEILDGRAAGRTALSGAPPRQLVSSPGSCSGSGSPSGRYCLSAIPPGTYRLRASADGFVSQEQDVVLTSVNLSIAVRTGQVSFGLQSQ